MQKSVVVVVFLEKRGVLCPPLLPMYGTTAVVREVFLCSTSTLQSNFGEKGPDARSLVPASA